MASADGSFWGIGKQASKGAVASAFNYILFTEGGSGINNGFLPLDEEIGGGPMVRDVVKASVFSQGAIGFIPRPTSIGHFLMGAMGKDTVVAGTAGALGSHTHTFAFNTDPYAVPYYTVNAAPGNMWTDQILDARVASLALQFKAAQFLRGQVALQGGLPTKVATLTGVSPDGGAQFLAPTSDIQLDLGAGLVDIPVLSGTFAIQQNMPLDEQWVVGSYVPDDFDVVNRNFVMQLVIKVKDATLYSKMTYDPGTGSNWLASVLKERNFKLDLISPTLIGTSDQYNKISVKAHATDDNVAWTCSPIALRAGKQVVMAITGTFLATSAGAPITIDLVNGQSALY